MAHHMSAKRQWRRSLRRRAINRRNKTILRTQIKQLRTAITAKDRETADKLLPETYSLIDRSVKKGAIHANTGNRYKARLSRQVGAINPVPAK
jgi:small subunit ribosomal protein S20